jgi:hypothetical protein
MGHGMGHGAWGMGHWAWGIGHGALGIASQKVKLQIRDFLFSLLYYR